MGVTPCASPATLSGQIMNVFASSSALGPHPLQDFSKISSAACGSRREAKAQRLSLPQWQRAAAAAQLCSVCPKGSEPLALLTPPPASTARPRGPISDFQRKPWAEGLNSIWSNPFFSARLWTRALCIFLPVSLHRRSLWQACWKKQNPRSKKIYLGYVCVSVCVLRKWQTATCNTWDQVKISSIPFLPPVKLAKTQVPLAFAFPLIQARQWRLISAQYPVFLRFYSFLSLRKVKRQPLWAVITFPLLTWRIIQAFLWNLDEQLITFNFILSVRVNPK